MNPPRKKHLWFFLFTIVPWLMLVTICISQLYLATRPPDGSDVTERLAAVEKKLTVSGAAVERMPEKLAVQIQKILDQSPKESGHDSFLQDLDQKLGPLSEKIDQLAKQLLKTTPTSQPKPAPATDAPTSELATKVAAALNDRLLSAKDIRALRSLLQKSESSPPVEVQQDPPPLFVLLAQGGTFDCTQYVPQIKAALENLKKTSRARMPQLVNVFFLDNKLHPVTSFHWPDKIDLQLGQPNPSQSVIFSHQGDALKQQRLPTRPRAVERMPLLHCVIIAFDGADSPNPEDDWTGIQIDAIVITTDKNAPNQEHWSEFCVRHDGMCFALSPNESAKGLAQVLQRLFHPIPLMPVASVLENGARTH